MESADSSRKVAVVIGDVTMDWNLATIEKSVGAGAAWSSEDTTQAHWQAGGTALLGALIEAVATPLGFTVLHVGQAVEERDKRFRHAYAVWSRFPYARGSKEPRVWRVEEFLGLDRRDLEEGTEAVAEWKRAHNGLAEADLVVLDDADLGFRKDDRLWPQALDATSPGEPWVLLKMARPVAQGQLWEHLIQTCPTRLIALMTINDLRLSEVRISRELSWERTAEDLAWELIHNPNVNALSQCAHVVVSLESGGALLLSSSTRGTAGFEEPPTCVLFYDPQVIEGTWAEEHPGKMVGYTSCLAASIARQIMLAPEAPSISQGIQRGLDAMRELHLEGYGKDDRRSPKGLAFPVAEIANVLAADGEPFNEIEIPPAPVGVLLQPGAGDEGPRSGLWTILRDECKDRSLDDVARDIAIKGVKAAVEGVPLGQFGKLVTVDREEMEGLRAISSLIREYSRQEETRPLSIAVFGPPGAGKSFAVKQVAASVLPDDVEELSFNLSQFSDPIELNGALHQVRDRVLEGKLPLVFWDEFDTTLHGKEGKQKLGWLRHFLVPMQDGTFQEGQITHPIGRAIFVFAGGVYEHMREFRTQKSEQDSDDFKEVKGPDFVSRLKGFVDVVGPNPRGKDPDDDPYFVVRRGILLRSIIERNRPHLIQRRGGEECFQIDPGVLRAFLKTREYRHGVRSLESIIAMSTLSGKSHFERSCLPADPQLDLHVDKEDFLALVQRLDAEGDLLKRLAEAVHVVYCEQLLSEGFVWAEPTNDYLLRHGLLERFAEEMADRRAADGAKTNRALVSFENLPDDLEKQNRNNARDIPNKLASAGYIMRPARSENTEVVFGGDEPDTIELLSEQEHERWMWEKLRAGWRWGREKDEEEKKNPALIPWSKLSDEEKRTRYGDFAEFVGDGPLPEEVRKWDRALVEGIPKILAVAGYTVVKHTPDGAS